MRALRSVVAQQLPADQVIVVDDGSHTIQEAQLRSVCGRAELISLPVSVGGSAARNIGIHRARCPVIMFLDDDDEWRPGKARVQCRQLASRQTLAGVSCHIDEVRGSAVRKFRYPEKLARRWLQYSNLFGSFSGFAVRRESAVHTLIDEALPALQDWDFYRRLACCGEVGLVEEPLVITHAHTGIRITTNQRARLEAYRILLSKSCPDTTNSGAIEWASAELHWAHALVAEKLSESLKTLLRGMAYAARSDYHVFLRVRATMRAFANYSRRLMWGYPLRA